MKILVQVHIEGDFLTKINTALIDLSDTDIMRIFKQSRKVKSGQTFSASDYTPDLGKSEIWYNNDTEEESDITTVYNDNYLNYDKLPKVFNGQPTFEKVTEDSIDTVELNVDSTDFWWSGVFKHTTCRWETRMIPIKFLPQELGARTTTPKAVQAITVAQLNAIHKNIEAGMEKGLNAREIESTLLKKATKAQLVSVIMELLERNS
jgi:hypothetical protein